MKTLSTYINDIAVLTPLKEGLLQGQDTTLQQNNPWREMYPVPTTKDFKKDSAGPSQGYMYVVEWVCPQLLQSVLPSIEIKNQDVRFNKDDAYSIKIYITNKVPYIYIKDSKHIGQKLYGVGFGTGAGIPQIKKDCIEFLNAVAVDPEIIVKCVKCNNYNYDLVAKNYKAHYMTFKEIINKF